MHETYMHQCIALAEQAKALGNIPVGSLVVLDGNIIAEAYEVLPNSLNITGHAEILAVQRACDARGTTDLSACTLYSTAEPCWMCSYTIRETKIPLVVIAHSALLKCRF
jgi:tRNA(adenine34) deaminase